MNGTASQSGVKSALRTLDLIEYVVARPSGVIAQELSSALAIPISSLSYLLGTLVERGYLRREGRRYYAGSGLDRFQRPQTAISLADLARPFVKSLRDLVNETTSLFIQVDWEVEAIVTETSGQPLRYAIEVGARTPMHCVSAGKALLAALRDTDLDRYFAESERNQFTSHTICERDALSAELETIRTTGVAFTRDEFTVGITGIGVAIMNDGQAVAALSVGAPTPRLTAEMKVRIASHVVKSGRAIASACKDLVREAA
ncbi:MAG TPA: IclR family transcriptional regulator [Sphingomonas sp.]|nr:IclR family transcriptional regulator [Sphingomonas sp.]